MSLAARPLGRTGLSVTPIGIGTARLVFVSMALAMETCRAILLGPLTHIDTAASYGNGETERRLGTAIERFGLPLGALLATKAGRDHDTNDLSGDQVYRSVERSLRLLNVDRLQLLYLHDPEYASEKFGQVCGPGGALSALVQLKDEGVVQAIGVAAGPIDVLIRYVETGVFDAVLTHNRYTLLCRIAEPLIRMAVQRGMAVVNAAPYASGNPCQRSHALSALRVSRGADWRTRPRSMHGTSLRPVWRASGCRGAAVFVEGCAYHQHAGGRQPTGTNCGNARVVHRTYPR